MKRARTLVGFGTAIIVGMLSPYVASAGHWWLDGGGNVVHLNRGHTPGLSFFNKANNGSATPLEHARGDWSGQSWAMDLGNWASDSADVIAWDGNWCGVGWSGIATPGAWIGNGHFNQGWVQINVCGTDGSYASNANYQGTKAIACQELGHVISGALHLGPGCMGVSYFVFNPWGDAAQRTPSAHDIEHANWLWSGIH